MGFWAFMTVCCMLIPLCMIIGGNSYAKKPPRFSRASGYRTAMSMKNADTWAFAHSYMGRIWKKWGIWTLIGTVPIMLYCMGGTEDEVGLCGGIVCLIQTIVMCIPIIMTERALKRNFHKDGTKRIDAE